jgi:hypothetical protein
VPPEHERDHETVHAKIPGRAVVNGRLVADGEVQVVVDLVPEGESDADVVERIPRDAIDARFAAVVGRLSNFRNAKMNIPRQRFKNTQRVSQPGVTAVEIRDPTVIDEDSGVLTRDLLQLEAKPLRARQIIVRLADSMVVFHATNLRVRTHTELHSGLLAYVTAQPDAGSQVWHPG